MRLLCCAFCFVFAFAVLTSLHIFTMPEGESGRRYLRRFSKMVLDATEQSPQWKDGPLVIPPEFKKFARVMPDGSLFVLTGDIADMWIRDSAAQVWPYRDTHPEMVKRVLQRQGMYILSDPYANSYKDVFRAKVSAADKRLGRGGWVATRNYEVDSGCYFLRLLHHMWKHHGLDARPFESAASALISTWVVEQRHEDQSPYRYPELPRNGKGAKTAYTGMTWGAFRPSDDACKYGYHIPSNLFVAEVMDYAAAMWGGDIRSRALRLQKDVLAGIAAHGIKDGMYCYEVDGLGHCNMMDDANVPSLLSIPYINSRHYDRAIWQNTYSWIWSVSNPYFFVGKEASGIGSPHTPRNHIWPMSIIVRGLVDPSAKSEAVQTIERTRTPAIHESFHKDNAKKFTRPWFGWVNALYSELKGASAPFEPSSGVVEGGEVREVAKRVEAKTKAREDVHPSCMMAARPDKFDIVMPLKDPTDPAITRLLRSFEKHGLLDVVNRVHVVANDDSIFSEFRRRFVDDVHLIQLTDIDVPFDIEGVKVSTTWRKLFAAPFIDGLLPYFLLMPDDIVMMRDFDWKVFFSSDGKPYGHSFGTARTGNLKGHRNIAPLHGPTMLNACEMRRVVVSNIDARPPIDPVSVTLGDMKNRGLLAGFFGYHDRRFREIAGADYFSECHTNGGCRRPNFDDWFVNIQGNGISSEYRDNKEMRRVFNEWFATTFPNPSRFEKRKQNSCYGLVDKGLYENAVSKKLCSTITCLVNDVPSAIHTNLQSCNIHGLQIQHRSLVAERPLISPDKDGGIHDGRFVLNTDNVNVGCSVPGSTIFESFGKKTRSESFTGRELRSDHVHEKTVVLITRKDEHNPFFMFSLIMNTWFMIRRWGLKKEFDLLVMDERTDTALESFTKKVLGASDVIYGSVEKDTVTYKEVYTMPSEYTGPLMTHLNDAQPCKYSDAVNDFVSHVKTTYGIESSTTPTILFLSRQHYDGRILGRVMTNEKEVMEATASAFPHMKMDYVDFVGMPIRDQIQHAANADVLISMHGAGLANVLWVPKTAHVIEIFPRNKRRWGYRNMCHYIGCKYTDYRGGRDGPHESKTIDVGEWKHFIKKTLESILTPQKNENVCLATAFQESPHKEYFKYSEYLSIMPFTLENFWEYGKTHGYRLYLFNNDLFEDHKKSSWVKINIYERYSRKCDWIMYTDVDFLFTDIAKPLPLHSTADLVVSHECAKNSEWKLMSGTMIMRSSKYTSNLFKAWKNMYEDYLDVPNHDQAAFQNMFKDTVPDNVMVLSPENFMTYDTHNCVQPKFGIHFPSSNKFQRIKKFLKHEPHSGLVSANISGKTVFYQAPYRISGLKCDIVVGIITNSLARRKIIRNTYSNECIFFIVGTTNGQHNYEEFYDFKDILLVDMEEVYSGEDSILPYKTQIFFHAVDAHKVDFNYAIKFDDDSFARSDLVHLTSDYWKGRCGHWNVDNAVLCRSNERKTIEPMPTSKKIEKTKRFVDPFSGGGMNREEQQLLEDVYRRSSSVFEWGMGSSTKLAEFVGIERLVAVDSALTWVDKLKKKITLPNYNLVYVNIGPIKKYGNPKDESMKDQWPDYSLYVDTTSERFDVYLVDGRFRVACACRALLHGGYNALVLIHDFKRSEYQVILQIAYRVEQTNSLVVLKRREDASDDAIVSLWGQYKYVFS